MLNGLGAWRRVVRIVEDTPPMRFEQLRRAAQQVYLKVIKDLEHIPNGIAEFQTTLEDYEKVGGPRSGDQERKSDLLAILLGRMQSDLLWKSTVPHETYEQFRDQVLTQSARMVDLGKRQGQRRGGIHAFDGREEPQSQLPPLGASMREEAEEDERENPISSLEGLLAMVNKARANGG